MRFCRLFAVFILILLPFSVNSEECEIEDWKASYQDMMQSLEIQGVATCRSGIFKLRMYEGQGENRKFYAVEDAFIEGYTFRAFLFNVEEPENLTFEYTYERW